MALQYLSLCSFRKYHIFHEFSFDYQAEVSISWEIIFNWISLYFFFIFSVCVYSGTVYTEHIFRSFGLSRILYDVML